MSNGMIPKGDWRYANFDMDDPDGPALPRTRKRSPSAIPT